MFDSNRIIQDIKAKIDIYVNKILKKLMDNDSVSITYQGDTEQKLSVDDDIHLLVKIANSDIPGDLADDIILGDVEDSINTVLNLLFASPGNLHHYAVPDQFWHTELGKVIRHCQLWLRGDDLINYTEAAAILYPDDEVQVARMRIKRMVERGELSAYLDPTENNPQRAARVSREEVSSYR